MKHRSGAGVKKPTQHERGGQLGAKLVVTSRKPQRQRRWRQTEMTGFAALRQRREEKKLDQGTNTSSSEQSDATEIVVKLEPATDVGSEPTASAADTETAERVAILEPRWICYEDVGDRGSRLQCRSYCRWRRQATLRRERGGGPGIGLAAT
ncbi:hypothetical protein PR003_g32916 [Phytophthora rubi]|uniref:Uncharacterized protein n=1 Tax=Phytophthora rubi TaxID=129364 RepID=A0A6A3H422_9STRA|nr:hypothetical protein PR002_g29161 [Phytophthora rubi]KAE9264094.1 hypothetical protein PR003_g32916 [Phytophthora rubi]